MKMFTSGCYKSICVVTEMPEILGRRIGCVDRDEEEFFFYSLSSRAVIMCWTLLVSIKPPMPKEGKVTSLKTEWWGLPEGSTDREIENHSPFCLFLFFTTWW